MNSQIIKIKYINEEENEHVEVNGHVINIKKYMFTLNIRRKCQFIFNASVFTCERRSKVVALIADYGRLMILNPGVLFCEKKLFKTLEKIKIFCVVFYANGLTVKTFPYLKSLFLQSYTLF